MGGCVGGGGWVMQGEAAEQCSMCGRLGRQRSAGQHSIEPKHDLPTALQHQPNLVHPIPRTVV